MYAVIETDSDGDFSQAWGPFQLESAAWSWLRDVCVPRWSLQFDQAQEEWGNKARAHIEFTEDGAVELGSCTRWVVKEIHPV